MPSVSPFSPPAIAPVFDAHNRWAALYVSAASASGLETELLPLLCNGGKETAIALLPILIRLDNPDRLRADTLIGSGPADPRVHFLVPSEALASEAMQQQITKLCGAGFKLVTLGVPPPALGGSVAAVALDCAAGVANGTAAIAQQCPGPLLALSVNDYATHGQCAAAGAAWFEGGWALHPLPEAGYAAKPSSTSRSTMLNLLALVASDADSHEIENLLKRDPNLSYQLLKLVNSVSFSLTHKISSFGQAITLLGRRQLQRWLQLLIYAGHHGDGSVSALLGLVALRAALMEALVEGCHGAAGERDAAYMVGMFSLLDVLFHAPIKDLVLPLNLDDAITQAVVDRTGKLGSLLKLAAAIGSNSPAVLEQELDVLEISPEIFVIAQLRAHAWAAQVCRDI